MLYSREVVGLHKDLMEASLKLTVMLQTERSHPNYSREVLDALEKAQTDLSAVIASVHATARLVAGR